MDINAARQHVLNKFPPKYQQHVLDFSNNLSLLDVDVLIFTARKSACFFHCLEYLRLWDAGERIVTTDRLVEHDTSWLRGKRIAIIDEVIVSGTSLYRLLRALQEAGVAEVKVHALFINKEWFVQDFFKNDVLSHSHILLDGPDAQALGTTIVRAFNCIPRPYSIDYPMSGWNTLSCHQADSLAYLPGWQTTQIEEQWGKAEDGISGGQLAFFRFEPEKATFKALGAQIGIGLENFSLVKVRSYGKWETTDGNETYHFRVVPYLILRELSSDEIDRIFFELAAACSVPNRAALTGSCVTGKSRLRLIQYVLASRLGKAWANNLQDFGIRVSFVEDRREVSFIFPALIHDAVSELSASSQLNASSQLSASLQPRERLPVGTLDSVFDEWQEPSAPIHLNTSQYLQLSSKFLDLYLNVEIPARQRAKELGEAYFSDSTAKTFRDRLNKGLTLEELASSLRGSGAYISENQISMFVDMAVDSGIVVPITVERDHDDGTRTLSRAYRHGEETYILQRDLGLFHSMLLSIADDVNKQVIVQKLNSALRTPHRLTKILLEKVLVLFLRYAIAKGIFPRVYADTDDRDPEAVLVGIGYDLFGARVARGDHKPTNLPFANTFVKWLLDTTILREDADDGYEVNAMWNNPYSKPDKTQLAETVRFSAVLASAVDYLTREAVKTKTPSKGVRYLVDRAFVTLTTCESEASTLMAIGAELRRFDRELENLGLVATAKIDFQQLVQSKRFIRSVVHALNSGLMKMDAFISDEAARNSERLSRALTTQDKVYGSLWDDIWEAAKRDQSTANLDALAGHLIGAVEVLLKALLLAHWVRSIALQRAAAPPNIVAAAAKSLRSKVSKVDQLVMALSSSPNREAHARLGAAASRARVYFDAVSSASDKDWPETSQRLVGEFVRLRVLARDQVEWIDAVTGDDGKIARLEEFDSVVVMKLHVGEEIWEKHFAKKFSTISNAAVQRFRTSTSGPRAYSKDGRINDGSGTFLIRPVRFSNGATIISFLSGEKRGASWLGYMFGECVKLAAQSDPLNIPYSASVVLGLENSRKIHRDYRSGVIVLPTTARALLQLGQQSVPEAQGAFAVVSDSASKMEYSDSLLKEMTGNLRRGAQSRGVGDIAVPSAGGSFKVEKFTFSGNEQLGQQSRRVAWVVIVEDEGASALLELEQLGIVVRTSPAADGKIVGEAFLPTATGKVTLRIYISSSQGNTPIGNLLSNIASTEKVAPNFIVVSGICCCLGESDALTKVVIPTSVLDTQLGVETNTGSTLRAAGHSFAQKPLQLVKWYLMLRGKRKLSSPGADVDDIKVMDNIAMVSNNDLLKTDNMDVQARTLARNYSDKAVAYDMETAGVVNWGHENPHFPAAVVIKGLSDLGLANKVDDENRKIAARNAMRISLDFIELSMSHWGAED